MPVETRITQVAIEDEMRLSYLDYAMSVIVGRASACSGQGFSRGSLLLALVGWRIRGCCPRIGLAGKA